RREIACTLDGEVLRLRTPYVLPSGERLEAWLRETPDGAVLVDDGGYAAEQIEQQGSAHPDPAAAIIPPIAGRLGLDWDDRSGVVGYVAADLDEAIARLPRLAQAVA